ncbi:nitrogen fixation protein NifW [Agarivorans sp. MS3-6]|uniref:nitrogen fixation protein NifW n=1 Tax=Agarivorans sp. TSD2052 TaxID=2937286 RepID=UPI00200E6297|nr:nitrogen fixation protein NifW [Agarivorans sp. TSD2052]UPW19739.1 nitrogen fixation protein NifW [Agarivorans sp. TSD2052]
MANTDIKQVIENFTCIEQALHFFEIDFDNGFINQYREPLVKHFNGNLILSKADDWFTARRALKNAYCKIQRGRIDKHTRSACRGCTSCERR